MKTLKAILFLLVLLSSLSVYAQPVGNPICTPPALDENINQPNPIVKDGVNYFEFTNNMYYFPQDLLSLYRDSLPAQGIPAVADTSFIIDTVMIPGVGKVQIGIAQISDPANSEMPRLFMSEGMILVYTLAAQATLREFDFGPDYTTAHFASFHNEEPPTDSVVNGYYADYMRCRRACMVQYPQFFRDCDARFESDFMVTVCYNTKKFACNKDCPGWHGRLVVDRSAKYLPDILH